MINELLPSQHALFCDALGKSLVSPSGRKQLGEIRKGVTILSKNLNKIN